MWYNLWIQCSILKCLIKIDSHTGEKISVSSFVPLIQAWPMCLMSNMDENSYQSFWLLWKWKAWQCCFLIQRVGTLDRSFDRKFGGAFHCDVSWDKKLYSPLTLPTLVYKWAPGTSKESYTNNYHPIQGWGRGGNIYAPSRFMLPQTGLASTAVNSPGRNPVRVLQDFLGSHRILRSHSIPPSTSIL